MLSRRRVRSRLCVLVVISLLAGVGLLVGPAYAEDPYPPLRSEPARWTGTISLDAAASSPGDYSYDSAWLYSDLVPTEYDGYFASIETSGTHSRQSYCFSIEDYVTETYTWDDARPSASAPNGPELRIDVALVNGDAVLSLTHAIRSALTQHSTPCPESAETTEIILADASGLGDVDFGALPDTHADPLRVVGSVTRSGSDWQEWSYTLTYDLTGHLCSSGLAGDADGDKLPGTYETGMLGSDPENCDTDADGYLDAVEAASGSSLTNPAETPDTLSRGVDPASLSKRGHAGVTCGKAKFTWVTPALKPLGVPRGRRACIFLLSNRVANAVLDTAFGTDKGSVTAALGDYLGPRLLEMYGEEIIDWTQEATLDAQIWGAKLAAKQALLKALNLTRINLVFTVGKVVGLAAVPVGAFWALKQVRRKNACVQVRVAPTPEGSTLSWSLVYNRQNLKPAGVKDGLHRAGVWKKKVRVGPDTAVRKHTNLSCDAGMVKAGGSASPVFGSAYSMVF